jgi:pimeloyl-ACP methyl ester carboxylesterase
MYESLSSMLKTICAYLTVAGLFALAVSGCAVQPSPAQQSLPSLAPEAAPQAVACPDGVPALTKCLRGQDSAGAHYLIAMPAKWSGVLVVHAHGGPVLGEPKASRADEDIKRWAITVSQGHAWAGSVFRLGGFAVTAAAEDSERVRRIFVEHVAKPRKTLLHGQSWGGMVATRVAEMYPKSWDGMLLTSGVVAGPATYDFRIDMRAIYQYLCANHPRPDEPTYPLSIGLPVDSKMTNAELVARVNECLALNKPAAERSAEQRRKISTIVDVVRVPESSIVGHLNWGTFTLRDVVQKNGGPPFGNLGVRYSGSADDAGLNAGVLRFRPDPAAALRFAQDADHSGRFVMPVLLAHGIGDSTVFVEGSDTLRQRMESVGNSTRLVKAFVDSREHSYWGDVHYPPLFEALLRWAEAGEKPSAIGIAQRCLQLSPTAAADCRFKPDYMPKALDTRIPKR